MVHWDLDKTLSHIDGFYFIFLPSKYMTDMFSLRRAGGDPEGSLRPTRVLLTANGSCVPPLVRSLSMATTDFRSCHSTFAICGPDASSTTWRRAITANPGSTSALPGCIMRIRPWVAKYSKVGIDLLRGAEDGLIWFALVSSMGPFQRF